MAKKVNPEMVDIENPEWKPEDFRHARSAAEVLPPELVAILPARRRCQRGPQRSPVKKQVTLRIDDNVLKFFKAKGRGWQTRINEALKRVTAHAK